MVKECLVKLNNDVVTVVAFGDIDIQFPSIRKNAKTVFVNYEDGKYSIVDENFKTNRVDKNKRKDTYKKTTIEESAEKNDIEVTVDVDENA